MTSAVRRSARRGVRLARAVRATKTADPALVASLDEKACGAGSAEGCLLAAADAADTDKARAVRWIEAGCQVDPADELSKKACYLLGMAYWHGEREKTNREAAEVAFKKACAQGYAEGCQSAREVRREIDAAHAPPELEGRLVARAGDKLRIKLAQAATPPLGASAEVSSYFEGKAGQASPLGVLGGLLGGTISGWLVVANGTVANVDGDVVTLDIKQERSEVKVNGKKVNHFTPGARMRITLGRAGH